MAEVYLKGGTEKCVILSVREVMWQPFIATNWTDLRVGFFLSIEASPPAAHDTITGLTETIGTPPRPQMRWTDRFSIGIWDTTGNSFMGFTNNAPGRIDTIGTSKLVSSDGGIGTSNTNFWRPTHELSDNYMMQIIDQGIVRAWVNATGSQLHLTQNIAGAGGYAALWALRFQRDNAQGRDKIIRMSCKTSVGNAGEIMFTSTPDLTTLSNALANFPTTVQQLGPVELSAVPNALFAYWPFSLSRLRIHSCGIYRAA